MWLLRLDLRRALPIDVDVARASSRLPSISCGSTTREGGMRIQHVTVTVPSEEVLPEVEAFYRELGGVILRRPPALAEDTPGRWIGFGETQLHLIVGDSMPKTAHFALDIGKEYDRVVETIVPRASDSRTARDLWGGRRTFVRDPVGNLIELFDRPPPTDPLP
jgi:catechol 2,3-dioxygenase-like lactoylglutathione lyase family enzyme